MMKNTYSTTASMRLGTRCRALAVLLLLSLVFLAGCERTTPTPAQREDIETFLGQYLPRLADAYREQNPQILEGYAVTKEIASIQKLVDELAERGERMLPTLQSFTIEEIGTWRSTAYVTTVEVWDLERRTLGSNVILQLYEDQHNRVHYQLEREGDGWVVLFRHVREHDIES